MSEKNLITIVISLLNIFSIGMFAANFNLPSFANILVVFAFTIAAVSPLCEVTKHEIEKRNKKNADLINKIPPSDMLIFCHQHGQIVLSAQDYQSQKAKYKCVCPICNKIPYKIKKI